MVRLFDASQLFVGGLVMVGGLEQKWSHVVEVAVIRRS
jgi:hypothetical protein